ncbi:MAG: alpha-ketoglutarate-dependent dioxygenase AlkB [Thermoleophilia bacterium]|jgi:alkylated DNA repair dioxygenase AlkB|nr:alpha-ketoglutarate-dependent dioxygenase AlkB [Thermoleophilia bacterium]
MARAAASVEEPAGLVYRPDFVTPDEEADLLAFLVGLDFREVVMHGQAARRTVRHYGFDYAYESRTATPGEPLPDALVPLRERCAELAAIEPGVLAEALVTRYPAGAGIGWHRDAPMFGSPVVGVSLGSACRMRFQRSAGGVRRTFSLDLEPRSAYVLAGAARWAWQHSIPATNGLRYSVTFRTLREGARPG